MTRFHFFRDVLGVLSLAVFSAGLGIWVQKPCGRGLTMPDGIAHPAMLLDEFRSHVSAHDILALDARNRDVFLEGHVPGALSLPIADFDKAYEKMKFVLESHREKLVVVYCVDMWCGQAETLQQKLIDYGYRHVGRFPDGWEAWIKAGFAVEKSTEDAHQK